MKNKLLWKSFIIFKFLILITSFSLSAVAATIYVDPRVGDDNLVGSKGRRETPFKTITRAAASAVSGDRIALLPGVFSHASGERFPIFLKYGVTINSAESTFMSNGVMRSVISGKKPDGTTYDRAFEVWGDGLTVEKVEISGFRLPFHVEASGVLRLNVVAFFNNPNGAFQAIHGGEVIINDITLGGGTGGFYVGVGSTVSAQTIYVHDKAKEGITVSGPGSSLSIRDLNFKGSPNLTLLKIRDQGQATVSDAKIAATGSCASPCGESPAIKAYETASLTLEGGEIKWNRPGYALYFEVDTVGRYIYSLRSGATRIERTFKNDSSGKGVISVGGTFGRWSIPRHETPQLEIKHPDGVGVELRHSNARAYPFQDVKFSSGGGTSILVRKSGKLEAYGLDFGSSKGTHIVFEEHTKQSQTPYVSSSKFSESATRALEIKKCASGSSRVDFRHNIWKRSTQGSNSNGLYGPKAHVAGAQSGGNYRIAAGCLIDISN